MASKWTKTAYPGVRFRTHPTRKHGIGPDKYFSIYFKIGGKQIEEGLGWASNGWTIEKAVSTRAELRSAYRTGEGPRTLKEKRVDGEAKRKAKALTMAEEERRNVTFDVFFSETYAPDAELSKKPETMRKEREHFKNWLSPVVGSLPVRAINLGHIKKVRADLKRTGRSPRTMQYVFRTFALVWGAARDAGIVDWDCPTKAQSFRLPKVDNQRERYLTLEESERLLEAVAARSLQVHDMTLLALHCGLRFSEVAGLTWAGVDLDAGTLRITNAKGDKSRTVPLTGRARKMLTSLGEGRKGALVFPGRGGKRIQQVPSSFKRAVEDCGLNEGEEDPRRRFGFHGLRHTYASWMVQSGVDLYRVQRLLGHSTPVMTARYGHLEGRDLEDATKAMERSLEAKRSGGKVVRFRQAGGEK